MKVGVAHLPLHYGRAPSWLFQRMTKLAREITIVIVSESGPLEMLNKLSDPFWFQAFGCVLGFDWHSSGLTTTVCGALKEGVKGIEKELGLFVAGGKGGTSRKTPSEIERICENISLEPEGLVYASRMSAKVDSTAVQDGYQLYHHCFFFTSDGRWSVIQQGMNEKTHYARRYHWISEEVLDFVCEPHQAICCDWRKPSLNLVAAESEGAREASTLASSERPDLILSEVKKLQTLNLPRHHQISIETINPRRLNQILLKTYERQPEDFETLLGMRGVGPKTIRALSLIAELVYGKKPSFRDPARFSFAHGGKDGHPYPVDRENYDRSISLLKNWVSSAKVDWGEKVAAIKRLDHLTGWHPE